MNHSTTRPQVRAVPKLDVAIMVSELDQLTEFEPGTCVTYHDAAILDHQQDGWTHYLEVEGDRNGEDVLVTVLARDAEDLTIDRLNRIVDRVIEEVRL